MLYIVKRFSFIYAVEITCRRLWSALAEDFNVLCALQIIIKHRLQNDLFGPIYKCVEWDVKLFLLTLNISDRRVMLLSWCLSVCLSRCLWSESREKLSSDSHESMKFWSWWNSILPNGGHFGVLVGLVYRVSIQWFIHEAGPPYCICMYSMCGLGRGLTAFIYCRIRWPTTCRCGNVDRRDW